MKLSNTIEEKSLTAKKNLSNTLSLPVTEKNMFQLYFGIGDKSTICV